MTDISNDKAILTAAKQTLSLYNGDELDARLHAARLSDEYLDKGDIDGHLLWEKIHRAIFDLTDTERDGGTVH